MYKIDFQEPICVHFIGIGGISMSGLAEVLLGQGFSVSGSDAKESDITNALRGKGIQVTIGQTAENITDDIELVVYTAAVHEDNPEYAEVVRRGIPMLSRAELLGQIMKNYSNAIAVAGTHGKTTTTGMLAEVLVDADADPTVSIGGMLPTIGGNIRVGKADLFVTEACEYTNSFLSFYPTIALILNVDADHLDFFKDLDDIASSFNRFARLVPKDGTVIIGRDSAKYHAVIKDVDCHIVTFGLKHPSDYMAKDIVFSENGCATFTATEYGKPIGSYTLRVPGRHNILNALAVIATCRTLGLPDDKIISGLSAFTGTARRFEKKGTLGTIQVIDDYAHHPAEITATLSAAKQLSSHACWVVFQPHTYTRTNALLPEFAEALKVADHVILAEIYAAREKNTIGITSEDLAKEIRARGGDAIALPTFGEIEDHLLENLTDHDILITMGAGDVYRIGEDLLGLTTSPQE